VTAEQVHAHLDGARMTDGEVGRALGVNPSMFRYGATTGTVAIRWDGARTDGLDGCRRRHRRRRRAPRARAPLPALLPSGDAYFLLAGAEREVLVPLEEQRRRLWPPRVWPGAVLVDGEIRGTWRRSQHTVRVDVWERLSRGARDAVKAEAAGLPLPGIGRRIEVVCNT
jgi:hypothetical protein